MCTHQCLQLFYLIWSVATARRLVGNQPDGNYLFWIVNYIHHKNGKTYGNNINSSKRLFIYVIYRDDTHL